MKFPTHAHTKNYGQFLFWKNGRRNLPWVLDSSLTSGVVAGSFQNQCQELLLLVEIVNFAFMVVPGSDLDQGLK